MRKVLAIAVGAALAVGFVGLSDAEARRKASVPKSKQCTGTTMEGKKVNFRCKANESCCFDGLMAKGNCVPKGQVCF